MDQPICFDNIREITGGDAALEAELFRHFFDSVNDCLTDLRGALEAGDEASWRGASHALKGVALNVGAQPLSELCRRAQNDSAAAPAAKHYMLAGIEAELERVRAVLTLAAA